MNYRTIRQRIRAEAKRATRPKCQCGAYLRPKNIHYYFNAFGERTPICEKCAVLVQEYIEIIW